MSRQSAKAMETERTMRACFAVVFWAFISHGTIFTPTDTKVLNPIHWGGFKLGPTANSPGGGGATAQQINQKINCLWK